jgi:hypothetical protein
MAYQSTGNTPTSIAQFAQSPLPAESSPEVRFTHWKMREIAKLGPTHPLYAKVENFWKNIAEKASKVLPARAPEESQNDFLARAKTLLTENKGVVAAI